eukprot:SAG31_NODE_1222_length_9294_cov_4.099184_4_plen_71_part_00
MDYLRAFQATGSLVRMIVVILQDMSHLLIVLAVILVGATFFLVSHSLRICTCHCSEQHKPVRWAGHSCPL